MKLSYHKWLVDIVELVKLEKKEGKTVQVDHKPEIERRKVELCSKIGRTL